jgi:predicted ferric reductase
MQDQFKLSRFHYGWIISLIVCLMPLVLWYGVHPAYYFFGTEESIYRLFAKSTALVGTAAFAWSLVLSARPRIVESWFNGLDKMYQVHRWLGMTAFSLLLLHPLFLTFKFQANSPGSAVGMWLGPNMAYNLGIIALGGMILLIELTVFARLSHQTFIAWHRFLGVFFIIGAAHAYLVKSELAHNLPLQIYMLSLIALATVCYLYYTVLGQVIIRRYHYQVSSVRQPAPGVTEITLRGAGRRSMIFTPGQFAFLKFDQAGLDPEAHPYSMASSNRDWDLIFVVKALGDDTTDLSKLQVGTPAIVEGPYGRFSYANTKHQRQIWVAGGIGVTPFLSMARSLRSRMQNIDLYYCTKNRAEAIYLDELNQISNIYTDFRVIPHAETESGFLTVAKIMQQSGDLKAADIMLCGPKPMTDGLIKQLKAAGIADSQIHFEEFTMS